MTDSDDGSVPVSDIHEDFSVVIPCHYDKVKHLQPATASKVKDLLSGMRAQLMRIILNWQQSGQGDGGTHPVAHLEHGDDDDDDPDDHLDLDPDSDAPTNRDIGVLEDREAGAYSSRKSFLGNMPSTRDSVHWSNRSLWWRHDTHGFRPVVHPPRA